MLLSSSSGVRVPSGVPLFSTGIQQNRIWWIWPSRLRRQIVALKIVGSSPIIHPRKDTRLDAFKSGISFYCDSFLYKYRISDNIMLRVGKQKKNIELNPKIQYITDRKPAIIQSLRLMKFRHRQECRWILKGYPIWLRKRNIEARSVPGG